MGRKGELTLPLDDVHTTTAWLWAGNATAGLACIRRFRRAYALGGGRDSFACMARRHVQMVAALSVLVFAVMGALAAPMLHAQSAGGRAAEDGGNGRATVVVVPFKGPIDRGLMILVRRAFRQVVELEADAVVVEIDTYGGRMLETEEIVTWMRSVEVPVYAFVNARALSAGAIISLGADAIFMAPGARIGSALPIMLSPGSGGVVELPDGIQEKLISDTRALVRGLAQHKGHNEDVAVAMVDPDREVVIGGHVVSRQGELLNLTAKEAAEIIPPLTRPLLATAIVSDIEALLAHQEVEHPRIVRFEAAPAEILAKWIVTIGPILFSIGLLALFIELRTPGLGLPAIVGVTALAIYFFGHYVAGLAGFEDLALVAIGLVLLMLELFVIPGFGVAGVLGLLFIAAGTVMGMIPYLPDVPAFPDIEGPAVSDYLHGVMVRSLTIIGISTVGVYLLGRFLPKTSLYNRLILGTSLTREAGYTSSEPRNQEFLGREGVAQTALRPAGIAMFGDDRLDVVTSGDMVAKGRRIRVIDVEGSRIIVEQVPEGEP